MQWGQLWQVGDDVGRAGGDADRDGEHEVDNERPYRHERPGLAESLPGCSCPPTAFGEARDELSIVGDDDGDDEYDEAHRRQNETEVAIEVSKCGFDGIGGRRYRIGHDRKGEGDQQYGPTAKNGEEPGP